MASVTDRVIPNTLNYTAIKPQAIESEIKITRFNPTTPVMGATGGSVLKFNITGQGFLDPYSNYIKFTVIANDLAAGETRFLDRSAHSFIQRLVIRSNGVEIERIDDYDIVAAMINDMTYSPEQNALHAWEGFPTHEIQLAENQIQSLYGHSFDTTCDMYNTDIVKAHNAAAGANQRVLGKVIAVDAGYDTIAAGGRIPYALHGLGGIRSRSQLGTLLGDGGAPLIYKCVGEPAFGEDVALVNSLGSRVSAFTPNQINQGNLLLRAFHNPLAGGGFTASGVDPSVMVVTLSLIAQVNGSTVPVFDARYENPDAAHAGTDSQLVVDGPHMSDCFYQTMVSPQSSLLPRTSTAGFNSIAGGYQPIEFRGHYQGQREPASAFGSDGNGRFFKNNCKTFVIPIYSGVFGLLMPDKKLLPTTLLPLDIEITLNPYALYSSGVDGAYSTRADMMSAARQGSRSYQITDFGIYSNVTFFEAEIHRALEAAVAEHGLFIYCNSFYPASKQGISQTMISQVNLGANLKSINSVHWVFIYQQYLLSNCARRLHFVSHNLASANIRNGTNMIPYLKVEGDSGTSIQSEGAFNRNYVPFFIETLKAWNKFHDPLSDGILQAYNMCSDSSDYQFDPVLLTAAELSTPTKCNMALMKTLAKQALVGRCQYAISLEGEDLGEEKTMITGRKSEQPFLIEMQSVPEGLTFTTNRVQSFVFPFLRHDFIVYIRPDLQIVCLGK